MKVVTPALHVSAGISRPRFGYMTQEQAAAVLEMLHPKDRARELVEKLEDLARQEFGFMSQERRANLTAQNDKTQKELLKVVKEPDFGKKDAIELLAFLYSNRDTLKHELKPEVFKAIEAKAKSRASSPPPVETEIPEAIKRRLGIQTGAVTAEQVLSQLGVLTNQS